MPRPPICREGGERRRGRHQTGRGGGRPQRAKNSATNTRERGGGCGERNDGGRQTARDRDFTPRLDSAGAHHQPARLQPVPPAVAVSHVGPTCQFRPVTVGPAGKGKERIDAMLSGREPAGRAHPLAFREMLPLVAGPGPGCVPRSLPTRGSHARAEAHSSVSGTAWGRVGAGGMPLRAHVKCSRRPRGTRLDRPSVGGTNGRMGNWGCPVTWCCVTVSGGGL